MNAKKLPGIDTEQFLLFISLKMHKMNFLGFKCLIVHFFAILHEKIFWVKTFL